MVVEETEEVVVEIKEEEVEEIKVEEAALISQTIQGLEGHVHLFRDLLDQLGDPHVDPQRRE